MDNTERRIAITKEYTSLLERCEELFFILRDMPRFGMRQWQVHFMKTFDVFTKLWKFQQENRKLLQEEIQLKRHQIGEIASKIGQLYYHYYLYTSDLKYLDEAMDFYSAILSRSYFKSMDDGSGVDMRVRSLRYLARYFVVALLLKNHNLMGNILQHLQTEIDSLPPDGSGEKDDWNLVVKEGFNFMDLDNTVTILNEGNEIIYTQQRLTFNKPVENKGLQLKNAVLIGGCEKQAKFSELTIDMFRMIQLIEYLPQKTSAESIGLSYLSSNPCKHLLYKPSFGQINAFLSAVYKDLPDNGILLFYISGDEGKNTKEIKKPLFTPKHVEKHEKEKFYPEDIAPFTRKPIFIIADIDKSDSYQCIHSLFNEPRVCLMSPKKLPDHVISKKQGSIFTLFLFEPLLAICRLCKIHKIQESMWKECKLLIDKVGQLSIEMLLEENVDIIDSFGKLLNDPFLKNIMSHFFICLFIFRLYKNSQGMSFLPTCSPAIPSVIINHKVLHRYVLDMLNLIEVRHLFFEHLQLPGLST